jgi:hypothetical protein
MSDFSLVQQIAIVGASITCMVLAASLAAASLYEAAARSRLTRVAAPIRRRANDRWTAIRAANDNLSR